MTMNRSLLPRRAFFIFPLILAALAPRLHSDLAHPYFPPSGKWERKPPAELGLDAAKLREAIEYAQANGSTWDFEKDQVRVFGTPLGPLPKQRAATNGIILRHGFIAAEFGDTKANDPVYSVAKSFLSTVCSLAVERGLIKDVNDPVAKYIHDGGYDSPHNAKITWKNHLQQHSEWEGSLWGKNADFVGVEQFGEGQRPPRAIQEPGSFYEYNDVRINRFSLSLLRLFGKGLPEQTQQRQGKAVNANVIVFVERAGLLNRARRALALAELLDAHKIRILTPQGTFPLAVLLEVVLPGNLGVVRRIVAAVVDILRDGIVNVFDQPALDREAAHGR